MDALTTFEILSLAGAIIGVYTKLTQEIGKLKGRVVALAIVLLLHSTVLLLHSIVLLLHSIVLLLHSIVLLLPAIVLLLPAIVPFT